MGLAREFQEVSEQFQEVPEALHGPFWGFRKHSGALQGVRGHLRVFFQGFSGGSGWVKRAFLGVAEGLRCVRAQETFFS